MLDLLHAVHRPPNSAVPIRLNAGFRSGLLWWHTFISHSCYVQQPFPNTILRQTHQAHGAVGHGTRQYGFRLNGQQGVNTLLKKS